MWRVSPKRAHCCQLISDINNNSDDNNNNNNNNDNNNGKKKNQKKRKKKKSTETHKKPGKYVNFDLLAGKILKGY